MSTAERPGGSFGHQPLEPGDVDCSAAGWTPTVSGAMLGTSLVAYYMVPDPDP